MKSSLKTLLIIHLLGTLACGSMGGQGLNTSNTPSSLVEETPTTVTLAPIPVVPNDNSTYYGDETKYPFPETAPYFEISATAKLIPNEAIIEVTGVTYEKISQQGKPTLLLAKKVNNPDVNVKITTKENGSFTLTLPADLNKAAETIQLVTLNENDQETSEPVILFIGRLYGFWRGSLEIDWNQTDLECIEQIPNIQDLEKPTRIFLYRPQPFQNQYLLNIFGMKHLIDLNFDIGKPFMSIHSSGLFEIDEKLGFSSHHQMGCFKTFNLELEGTLAFEEEVYGIEIYGDGPFTSQLSGPDCTSSCKISGHWNFNKFLPFFAILEDLETISPLELPEEKLVKIDYEKIYPFNKDKIQDGPLTKLLIMDPSTIIGISPHKIYQLNLEPKSTKILFDLKNSKENLPEKWITSDNYRLLDLVKVNANAIIVTYHQLAKSSSGFCYLNLKALTSPICIEIPEDFSFIYSPVIINDLLYLIATDFNFSQLETSLTPYSSSILVYNLSEIEQNLHQPEWIIPTNIQNPIQLLKLNQDELWILDGSFENQNNDYNYKKSGGFEVINLDQLRNQNDFFPISYMPQWETIQKIGFGIQNLKPWGQFTVNHQYQKLFISGEKYSHVVDYSEPISTHDPAKTLSNSNHKKLKSVIYSSNGGTYPVIYNQDGYFIEFSSWEDKTGLIISAMKPKNLFSLNSIVHSKNLIFLPVNFWDERGAVLRIGKDYLVSIGKEIYRFNVDTSFLNDQY